jgi:hypothetical protein
MHKSATKCNETVGKWCKSKHGASKIIDTFETYQLSRAWVKRGAGSMWVLAVARAEPFRLHIQRWKRWSGASLSRGGPVDDASVVSSAATKLAPVGSPSVASVAVVRVIGSVTVIVDLQPAALLLHGAALQPLFLLALLSLGPGPTLCTHHRHLLPLPELAGMSLTMSLWTPTCRPSLLPCALSSSSLLQIASKR